MSKYILASLSLLVFCSSYAQDNVPAADNDTTATYLQEYVVESKNAWIENDKAVFVPTRREKNRANSVETLISSMNLPLIKVVDNTIKSLRGDDVKVFINGQEATGVELSTFWPKDVIRVEYLADPSDPKYKGYRAVVNFIMPKYSVGGVTKVNTYQSLLPYSSIYTLSSKLVHGRMTYGLMVNGRTSDIREGQFTNIKHEEYRDIWYGGRKYDKLINTSETTDDTDWYGVNAAFNAIYTDDKTVRVVHTASLAWDKYKNSDIGKNNWMPDIFDSNNSFGRSCRKSISPQFSGKYIYMITPKWQLNADWKYSYASIDKESGNKLADLPEISNASSEKANVIYLSSDLAYILAPQKMHMQLQLSETINTYSIQYSGTYQNLSRQTMSEFKGAFLWFWRPDEKLQLTAIPGFTVNTRAISGLSTETSVNPYFYLSANWYQSAKAFLSIYGNYGISNTQASRANEVLQRQSELLWFKGNPELSNMYVFTAGLQQTWMPAEWLMPSLNVSYLDWNPSYSVYFPASEDMEGLIEQYDDAPSRTLNIGLDVTSNLFNRKVSISLSPSVFVYQEGKSIDRKSLNTFNFSGRASYNFGNFSVNVSYSSRSKVLSEGGHMLQYRPDNWGAGITYGNGDLYVGLSVYDIFHTRCNQIHDFVYNNYIYSETNRQLGRRFTLNLSYTFGYGKRVNQNIDIQAPSEIASGAAGS